jgi:hypothetical protein
MEFGLLALVGISLATMFFGYFFGLFEGRGQGYKKRSKEEALDRAVSGAINPAAGSSPAQAEIGFTAEGKQAHLALGIDDHGRPLLHLEGRRLDPDNVAADQRKRLIELMVMLRPWIDPSPAAGGSPAAPSVPLSVTDRLRAATDSFQTTVPPGPPAIAPMPASPAAPALSMVAQIDSILQGRLVGTSLAKRGIRLAESLHGGATVFVGQTQYAGVADVPDPEVQAAIRAAIAEWEKTITPGAAQ